MRNKIDRNKTKNLKTDQSFLFQTNETL